MTAKVLSSAPVTKNKMNDILRKQCIDDYSLFIFQGGGLKIISGRYGLPVYPSTPVTNQITLFPENFLVSETAQPISRRDFLSVLANVTKVMVRATYSTDATAVYR